jgi:putative ABC transport system ATP-binding protein
MHVPALKGMSFHVRAREFVAIVGASGAGKSTLLNMISGVDALTSSAVSIGAQNIHNLGETRRARWRGASLGIVFRFFALLPAMTLLNNVMLPMELAGKYTPAERRERAAQLLESVGLQDPEQAALTCQRWAAAARRDRPCDCE